MVAGKDKRAAHNRLKKRTPNRSRTRPVTRTRERMDVGCVFGPTEHLQEVLESRVIGQGAAMETLVCSYSRVLSGLRDPDRPILTVLLLGPTGVGKTETARALAQALFGSDQALTRVDCEEYAHGHELAKLLGSPPGYVEHDIEPLLSQKRIDSPHWKSLRKRAGMLGEGMGKLQKLFPAEKEEYLSIVLFDEIEKAHPVLWNATLGILEEGRLTLGNNTTTNFTRSIIMMTSNVGSREMKDWLERRPVGFQFSANESKPRATNLEQAVLSAGPRSISS